MEDRYIEVMRNEESPFYRVILKSQSGRVQIAALADLRDALTFAQQCADVLRLSVFNSTGEGEAWQ